MVKQRTFDNFYSALDAIEDFKIIELPKVYSGSEMMMTDDLTAQSTRTWTI
jgi:hypothetical protein